MVNLLNLGWSIRKIVKYINKNAYTISREVRRNSINGKYLTHM
ncbi:helix-turn-helix domain-containing protein [Romboutsia ilealis]|nr:helix-turn-helix domain-containing protein [Romboutsia sp.]